ncbi:MAG: hypothetical protein V7K90_21410 [Nostoc sp.]|uniref:hypothetical protein n=1 Tax=Nostoc sp. TaxID=1180 RepID=UPI002FFC0169
MPNSWRGCANGLVQLLPNGKAKSEQVGRPAVLPVKSSLLRTNEGLVRNFGTGNHYQLRSSLSMVHSPLLELIQLLVQLN